MKKGTKGRQITSMIVESWSAETDEIPEGTDIQNSKQIQHKPLSPLNRYYD